MAAEIFLEEKIEYFSAVDYAECRIVNSRLNERIGFVPRSVIIFLLPYYSGATENISLYAASLDYHIIIKEIAGKIIEKLKKTFPVSNFAPFGDHSPVDERDCALKGGLGFIGDNGLLINEKYGSYVFLGDIVTDIDKDTLVKAGISCKSRATECCHCGKCRNSCPTGILRGESDACLSAITQRRGELADSEIELMRKFNTVWGCDLCQTSCPYNENPVMTPIQIFYCDRISGLDKKRLDSLDDASFSKRAFAWRGRGVLERNIEALYGKKHTNINK